MTVKDRKSIMIRLGINPVIWSDDDLLSVGAKTPYKDIRESVLKKMNNRNSSFLDAMLTELFTVPSDGCVDYTNLFTVLKQVGYKEGWLIVEAEHDSAIASSFHYASLGYKNLKALAQQTGLI